jgi:hypothetical protein
VKDMRKMESRDSHTWWILRRTSNPKKLSILFCVCGEFIQREGTICLSTQVSIAVKSSRINCRKGATSPEQFEGPC